MPNQRLLKISQALLPDGMQITLVDRRHEKRVTQRKQALSPSAALGKLAELLEEHPELKSLIQVR